MTDRDKLLRIMNNLEADYRSGKISAEKYSYFRSKYEDKLNTIDAQAATRRIRSMQGKSSNSRRKKRSKRPSNYKRKEEQDLVQKYIINPKKGDTRYKQDSSMDGGTFKLLLLLVLVIGFTTGVAYGIFNFDFDSMSQVKSVAVVQDTAFIDISQSASTNTTSTTTHNNNYSYSNYSSYDSYSSSDSSVVTTTDSSNSNSYDSNSYDSSSSNSNSYDSSSSDSSSSNSGSRSSSSQDSSFTDSSSSDSSSNSGNNNG